METVDNADDVEKYDDRFLLWETFLTYDIVLQVHEVRHFVSELVRDNAVKN